MIYSLHKINEMADGDEDFIQSVVTVFLEEVPQDLEDLEKAINEGDHQNIYMLGHKIKPNVDLLGMEEARATAFEIETLGKDPEKIEVVRSKFPLLKKDVLQVISELKKDFSL
ncbi:Hpt domain-containing protein [Eudoraea chungangensis]|uniref:Hpt domain-containing protein n=1 Tax=Eudoraea chungangensis TaxID=1481905 RepID=UPI0023ECF040|nr:Hpt domain-containing protein [Eudoraea chungangensis]